MSRSAAALFTGEKRHISISPMKKKKKLLLHAGNYSFSEGEEELSLIKTQKQFVNYLVLIVLDIQLEFLCKVNFEYGAESKWCQDPINPSTPGILMIVMFQENVFSVSLYFHIFFYLGILSQVPEP